MTDTLEDQSVALEAEIIGGLLMDPERVDEASDVLALGDFVSADYRAAYATIQRIVDNLRGCDSRTLGDRVNAVIVARELARDGRRDEVETLTWMLEAGGAAYTGALVVDHARRVAGLANLRRFRGVVTDHFRKAATADPLSADVVVDGCVDDIMAKFATRRAERRRYDLADAADTHGGVIEQRQSTPGAIVGIGGTGMKELDALLRGWRRKNVYVFGAFSGHGKTAFAWDVSLNCALNFEDHVMYFTLEVPEQELMDRAYANLARVPLERVENGMVTVDMRDRLRAVRHRVTAARQRMTIIDDRAIVAAAIDREIRRYKRQAGVRPLGLVVIDYLQRVKASARMGNREQDVAAISNDISDMAGDHDVPIVVLAQLNRDAVKRPDKRPVVSDLRESAAIEHVSAGAMFLHRPEMWDSGCEPGKAEVIIRKHRQGRVGTAYVAFDGDCQRFRDLTAAERRAKSESKPDASWHDSDYRHSNERSDR